MIIVAQNKKMINKTNFKTIAENRKAFHEYYVIETFETGIELVGTEVKSLRNGGCNLKDAWVSIEKGQMLVKGMHISPYEMGNIFNRDPLRYRRLLMHKKEILSLFGKIKQEGLTLIPLSVYFKGSLVKMKLGLCKGKKLYDKRAVAAKRDAERDIDRAVKTVNN
ncbi:SsrA-binding protein [Clostridia bacterium]|nr:SsrA-binding protein [Clostridia bacterium]